MADFVLLAGLLIFLLFAVLQVAVLFYIRNIVAASAADGARYAASSNIDPTSGADQASAEIRRSLSGSVADNVPCTAVVDVDAVSGLSTTVVRCRGTVRSIFLPVASFVRVDVTARSLTEPPT